MDYSRLDNYELLEEVGVGGIAAVYKACSVKTGEIVALKELLHHIDTDQSQREMQGLRKCKDLDCPYLVRIIEHWEENRILYIVMEYAPKGDLTKRLEECQANDLPGIPEEELITYWEQIAQAIDYLHDKGIQHRDIKPQNILLFENCAKLTDFGMSREIKRDHSTTKTTGGTIAYSPPEMFDGKFVARRSDQYCFAYSYAELRLGRCPYPQTKEHELAVAHMTGNPNLDPLPQAEQRVLRRALSRDPNDRYGTCQEFVAELKRAIKKAGGTQRLPIPAPYTQKEGGMRRRINPYQVESVARRPGLLGRIVGTIVGLFPGQRQPVSEVQHSANPEAENTRDSMSPDDHDDLEVYLKRFEDAWKESLKLDEQLRRSKGNTDPEYGIDVGKTNIPVRRSQRTTEPEPVPRPAACSLQTNQQNVVDCSVFAPPDAAPGQRLFVQVFLHPLDSDKEVHDTALEFDEEARRRAHKTLAAVIEPWTRLQIHLAMPDLEIEGESQESLIWRGRIESVQFAVRVPSAITMTTIVGTATVIADGVPLGHLKFKVRVIDGQSNLVPRSEPSGVSAVQYEKVFVSFDPADKDKINSRLEPYLKRKVRLLGELPDAVTTSSTKMNQLHLIDETDLFLLFWSETSQKSPKVVEEYRYALRRKTTDALEKPEIITFLLSGALAVPSELKPLSISATPSAMLAWVQGGQKSCVTSEGEFSTVGRYQILGMIGEGAFGRVFQAYDPDLDRMVAIKMPKPDTKFNEEQSQRFLREARAAAKLRHRNIVPVYDFGREEERWFIVSALIEGRSLKAENDKLRHQKRIGDFQESAQIIRQLAEALDYAHGNGVVHRDVKPANVMMETSGVPLLMDFGLAKQKGDVDVTLAGAVLGTPLYMAPEQARGKDGDPHPASDQYSLGVMMFEMLTGRPIYQGDIAAVLKQHEETPPTSPELLNPRVPKDLSRICLRTLEKSAANRYPTCHDLAIDLDRWMAQLAR